MSGKCGEQAAPAASPPSILITALARRHLLALPRFSFAQILTQGHGELLLPLSLFGGARRRHRRAFLCLPFTVHPCLSSIAPLAPGAPRLLPLAGQYAMFRAINMPP
jgi:hypothetical protein|tara:strand:+ start:166 stop:486 length:321 start_codon:yes stop_codon:yes gene_type:complete